MAARGGASRVELCQGLVHEGGTTPSFGLISEVRRALATEQRWHQRAVALHVMIRPRAGDFVYDQTELAVMAADIEAAKRAGADGVVLGCLRTDGNVDTVSLQKLAALARPLAVVFHRAFDMTVQPTAALEQLIDAGCAAVLTSGCASTVVAGTVLLQSLVDKAAGRIVVMPGAGVREQNIKALVQTTHARWVHVSARKQIQSPMVYRNTAVSMGAGAAEQEYGRHIVDEALVQKYVRLANE